MRGYRSDDAHAKHSMRCKRLQVSLDSRTAAGIRPGNRQCFFHVMNTRYFLSLQHMFINPLKNLMEFVF